MSGSALLAVDVGNTQTVLGVFDGPELFESWRVKTEARSTADELALLSQRLNTISLRLKGLELKEESPACEMVEAA